MANPGLIVRVARATLRCTLPPWVRESARGDLDEEHARIVRERGRAAAARWYLREALLLGVRYTAERRHGAPNADSITRANRKDPMRPTTLLVNFARDLRLVARHVVARPGFWLAATLTLGVAIGCNAAIFPW